MEAAALKLQKESKGYLDSLRGKLSPRYRLNQLPFAYCATEPFDQLG